jgi:hypothetical protein
MVRSLRVADVICSTSHGCILSQNSDGKGTAFVVYPKIVKVFERVGRQAVVEVTVSVGKQFVRSHTDRTRKQEELVQRDVLRSPLDVGDRSALEPNALRNISLG